MVCAGLKYPDFKTSLTLTLINGTSITTYGTTTTTTIQPNGCTYEWKFTFAQTIVLLLGADFRAHHERIVDFKHGCLVDPETIMAVKRNPVQQPVNTPWSTIQLHSTIHVPTRS